MEDEYPIFGQGPGIPILDENEKDDAQDIEEHNNEVSVNNSIEIEDENEQEINKIEHDNYFEEIYNE